MPRGLGDHPGNSGSSLQPVQGSCRYLSNIAGPQCFCHLGGKLRVGARCPCWESRSGDANLLFRFDPGLPFFRKSFVPRDAAHIKG